MPKQPQALTKRAQAAAIFIALTAALAGAPASLAQSSLPQLGDGQEMSIAAERKLGQSIAREIYRDPDYLDDPVIGDYVQRIWQPLVQAARVRGDITPELAERFAWEVVLARDRSVNAFALPGGYLGVHLGLIAMVGNRDELASVLAHELSHVTQRHIARMTTQQAQQAPWLLGAMILGAVAARKNSDAANALITGSQAVSAQTQLNFSRDMEREADRIGYQVMQGAQFNVQGFVGMFDKLALANRINDSGSFPYLRTHPLTSERIGDMQARMQLDPPRGTASAQATVSAQAAQDLASEHALIATRARLLADPAVDNLRAELAQAQAIASSSPAGSTRSSPGRGASQLYGGALAALKLRDLHSASALATRAIEWVSNGPTAQANQAQAAIDLLAAEIAIAQGKHDRAQSLLQPYVQAAAPVGAKSNTSWIGAAPPPRAALLLWAQSVTAQPPSATAIAALVDQLQTWLGKHPQDALAWEALAAAYGAQNQRLRAIRAQAEARVAVLDYAAALDRFKAGQELARRADNTDHIEQSILDTRARDVQAQLRELQMDKPGKN